LRYGDRSTSITQIRMPDPTKYVGLVLGPLLFLPLWLAVEEVVHRLPPRPKEAARVEMRRTARKPERVTVRRVLA